MNHFTFLSKEEIEFHTESFITKINNEYVAEVGENGLKKYRLALQDQWFECAYDEEELRTIIQNSILLVQHFKKRINAGYGLEQLTQDYQKALTEEKHIYAILSVTQKIAEGNEDISRIKQEIYAAARLGGAYLAICAGPVFESVIYSTYNALCQYKEGIPLGNDQDLELSCEFFLIRGAMKLHSNEIDPLAE